MNYRNRWADYVIISSFSCINLLKWSIISEKGTINITYDANGVKLKQIITPVDGNVIEILYHGELEYVNNKLSSIYHEEGRVVYNNTESDFPTNYIEYNVTDHLGNTRARCVDNFMFYKVKF